MIYVLLVIVILVIIVSISDEIKKQKAPVENLCCKKCSSQNINVSMQTYTVNGPTTTTTHKRSLASRGAESVGRSTANIMTLGLYGVTHKKKGKYTHTTTQNTRVMSEKVAICQQCGFSWNIR